MPQTLRLAVTRRMPKLKAFATVKSVYTLAFALLLATGTLVAFPLSTTLAANCQANCNQGQQITITGASTCTCTDNVGCTWTFAGKNYSSACGPVN